MSHRPAVVVPGNHDGVHLGHRALLDAGRARAGDELDTVALFFVPHPAEVLAPERAPPALTSADRRTELLMALGADRVHQQTFDRDFASLSPEAFVEEVLVRKLETAAIVVGPDFRFGQGRAGDIETLEALGATHGFDVRRVEPITIGSDRVSSTRIRTLLAAGEVGEACRLLGRVHDVTGRVVRGDQRGRTIGFPTANLDPEKVVLPSDGVYAVVAKVLDEPAILHGVANLGVRPTFEAGRSVEVHLFDFDRDVYDQRLRVGFVARVRGEKKFDGLEELVAQIGRDADEARKILAEDGGESWRWL